MLKDLLKENKDLRRLFGKKEIEIMIKQIEGSALTQSEKNRLSRDIRPKLEVISKIAEFGDDFELKKNQDSKKMIEKAVETILHDEMRGNIKAILLFGSFASGSYTQRSDIDICVIFREEISLREAVEFRIRISGELPEKIDVQVLNALPWKVRKEIAKNHVVLYNAKDYDNVSFVLQQIKSNEYEIRMRKIFGNKHEQDTRQN